MRAFSSFSVSYSFHLNEKGEKEAQQRKPVSVSTRSLLISNILAIAA